MSMDVSEPKKQPSVFRAIQNGQLSGKNFTHITQMPEEWMLGYDMWRGNAGQGVSAIVDTIRKLDVWSVCLSGSNVDEVADVCFLTLKDVLHSLTNYEARRSTEETGAEELVNNYAKMFVQYNGVTVIERVLMFESLLPPESLYSENQKYLRLKALCLEIFTRLISTDIGEDIARQLTGNIDLITYLFTLLVHDKTFLPAAQLLEDILQEEKVFNLTQIKNLRRLISSMDDSKLANFCRVLAVTISDLDIYENKSSLFAQNKQKRSKGFVNARDINQEYLLSFPELLPRLVHIITNWDYTPRYRNKSTELDCWMEWIDNALSDLPDNPDEDDFDDFIGGISEASGSGGILVQQPGNRITFDLQHKVEVVYVLGLFLVGKHRKKVQRKLAEMRLIPGLSEFFEQFIWKCTAHPRTSRHRLRGHNSSCECSPEVALKIQFLRLVHSFCDHSEFKHLMLSKTELNEIKRINAKAGPLQVHDLEKDNKHLMCKGSRGLLTKIVEVMKKEPQASTFRFWLARAVESYLRGHTSFCDQIFLLRRGLLQHVAGNMVDHDIRPKEIVQSSFDLLGELMKFNVDAFKHFDKVLCTRAKSDKFEALVNKNLVDSNMFIRSMVLSLEHFRTTQPEYADYANKESILLKFVLSFEQQLEYLFNLIKIINVTSLTQENVSCLNTTLVFLMFAAQRKELPRYLNSLKNEKITVMPGEGRSENIMRNFRDLLVFWQEHYLHKDKDCSALEKSSRISFDFWKKTVTTLVSDDRNCETSLVHYIPPCSLRDN